MRLADRVESLKAKHAALEQQINDLNRGHYPDTQLIKEMKLKKLAIKDELERIKQ